MKDLFGNDVVFDANAPAMTELERKRLYRRNASHPRGHAAPPGTGPEGETCGSCAHYTRRKFAGTYRKCGLMEAHWTNGPKSDIRAKDPACKLWAAPEMPAVSAKVEAA